MTLRLLIRSAHLILVAFVPLSFGALFPQTTRAADFLSHTYPASTNANELQIDVTFHLWLPPHPKNIRAVIIHQQGCGEGAESFGDVAIHDLHWRALAAAHDAAYLCPHYRTTPNADCRAWYDPPKGSGAILQRALDDFSVETGHRELGAAPLCLW